MIYIYKVLVVDDEELICKAIESKINRLVFSNDIDVILTFSGQEAFEVIIACEPDIIITDICMPNMNGLDLIKKVKTHFHDSNYCPNFIALSAYDEFDYVRQAFNLGVIDYLLKPIGLSDLQEVLEKAISSLRKHIESENHISIQKYNQVLLENSLSKIFVNTEVDVDIIRNRIEQIGAYYKYSLFSVVIIDVRNELNSKVPDEIIATLDAEKEKIAVNNVEVLHLCDQMNMITMLFNFDSADKYNEIVLWLLYLYNLLNKKFAKVFISISNIQEDIYTIYSLYRQAYETLMYRILFPEYKIIEYPKLNHKSNDCTPIFQRLDTLRQYARTNSINKMSEVADNVFNKETLMNISIEDFRKLYNYVILIFNECYSIDGKRDYDNKQFDEFYNLSDMRIHIKDKVNNLKYLIKNQNISNAVDIAIKYIRENYHKDINMAVTANIINMDYSYFGKLFKKAKGISFVEYLTSVRMEKAIELLRDPINKVSEISKKLGYNNPKHFTRVFKIYFGVSPREYREKNV